jgi:hypothetical protein
MVIWAAASSRSPSSSAAAMRELWKGSRKLDGPKAGRSWMRQLTRPGLARAYRRVVAAPNDVPPIAALSHFMWSRTAPTSAARSGSVMIADAVSP